MGQAEGRKENPTVWCVRFPFSDVRNKVRVAVRKKAQKKISDGPPTEQTVLVTDRLSARPLQKNGPPKSGPPKNRTA